MVVLHELVIPINASPVSALLAASGVARWIAGAIRLHHEPANDVRIRHAGHSLVVALPEGVTVEMLATLQQLCPWLLTKNNGPAPTHLSIIDYEAERMHNQHYYDRLKVLQKEGISIKQLSDDGRAELEAMAPREFWPVVALINQMSAISAYNKAVERWAACASVFPQVVDVLLTLFDGKPRAIERAETQWQKLAKQYGLEQSPALPATQIVNPEQGKGANRAKADALTIGGMDGFWLLEYFKYVGLYVTALPRTVRTLKDRKTYIVVPSRDGLAFGVHQNIFTLFQKELWANSSVKMDILAVLGYTRLLVSEWEGAQLSSGRRRRPSDYVEGLAIASYKDLGSAFAVMNVAILRLPDWVPWPSSVDQATTIRERIIDAHLMMIRMLDEKKSEEERLLRSYRDFLSSRDPHLSAFFDFTTDYARHAMRRMSKRQPVFRLSVSHIKEIVMANEPRRAREGLLPLAAILESQGFRNIATAIRLSTVTQQYYKAKHDDSTYDIRYGLADDLRRHSRNRDEFVAALSDFLGDYLKENARVMERMLKQGNENYRKRIPVSTDDLTEIAALIDTYGAPTIANLLIAYGYARDTREKDVDPDPQDGDPLLTQTSDDDSSEPF